MRLVATLLCVAALGCAGAPWRRATLYDDLGGGPGIRKIVSNLLDHLAQDDRIVALFDDTDMDRFERMLALQLCEISDGPCKYTGDDMVEAHKGLAITQMHFNALVEDLQDAMSEAGIPFATQNRLLARLAPMHGDIVEGKP